MVSFAEAQIDGTLFLKLTEDQIKSIVNTEEAVLKLQKFQLKVNIINTNIRGRFRAY